MFKTGMAVSGKDFIDRKEHLILFKAYLDNNQHIMIKAPRRFGKTSLVKQLFLQNNYKSVYVDIRRASDLKHLGDLIIDEVYKLFGVSAFIKKSKDSLFTLVKEIKASAKFNLSDIAEITLEKITSNNKDFNNLEHFLFAIQTVEDLAIKNNINIKLAIDEFQDIQMYDKNILNHLRSVVQHHSNVTYVFLGSIESIMSKIFSSKKSPFFHFAKIIDLKGLDINELYTYVSNYLKINNIKFNKDIKNVFVYLDGHPLYCMKFMQILYYNILVNHKKEINKEDYILAFKETFFDVKSYLEEVVSSIKQKKYHFELIYNIANNNTNTLSADITYKTHKSLENMGLLIKQDRAKYKINDKLLILLLQQKNEVLDTDNLIISSKLFN